jgi:nitrite reductase/ring-hydroxylating ferredoxin subunit
VKKYIWHKIADSINELHFNENNLLEKEVDGKIVCIARSKDLLFGCAQKCPHAGGFMEEGFIDAGGNIVCPLHGYKFNLQNGRNVSGEGYYLKVHPVEVRQNGIFIGIADTSLFGWRK